MVNAKDAVVWVNRTTREVMVWPHKRGCPEEYLRPEQGSMTDQSLNVITLHGYGFINFV
jgi:hypothetical protein